MAFKRVLPTGLMIFVLGMAMSTATFTEARGMIDVPRGPAAPAQTTVTRDAVADATVRSWDPDTNFGGEASLELAYGGVNEEAATLVRFDLSSLPSDAVIDAAYLRLYLEGTSGADLVSVDAYFVTSSWGESTVTWNSDLRTAEWPLYADIDATVGVYKSWYIPWYVQSWVDDPGANYGVLLRGPTDGTNYGRLFVSREAGADVPQLEITYHLAPYTFTGYVYEGEPEDTSTAMEGATVELWGDEDEWPEAGSDRVRLTSTTTSSSGAFSLEWGREPEWPYVHVIEVDPAGADSTGAAADSPGTVTNANVVTYRYDDLLETGLHDFGGIAFWDQPVLTREPTDEWIVNITLDHDDGQCEPLDVGDCTLREAMRRASEREGPDTILFDIPTADPGYDAEAGQWIMALEEVLPGLDDPGSLVVDATPLGPGDCSSYFVIDAAGMPFGLEITGANKTFTGLVIRNAQSHGLYIHGTGAQNNQLMCSYVVHNSGDGIRIADGATNNTIGSTAASKPNVIGYNSGDGVEITTAANNTLVNNHIGANLYGTAAYPNGGYGVRLSGGATANTIGLNEQEYSNLIGGNASGGILITGDATRDNVVQANRIGTNAGGTAALGSQQDGVVVAGAPDNTVGPGNLISGHTRDGVCIEGGQATGNVVKGNYIGTDAGGTSPVSNQRLGILLQSESHSNTIGTTDDGNVISGNGYDGDYAMADGVGILVSNGNELCNNTIGLSADGRSALPNAGHGVRLSNFAQDNAIGLGTEVGCANTIAWNEGDGVYVHGEGTVRNTIGRNSIYGNAGLGINNELGGNEELASPTIQQYSVNPVGAVELKAVACPGCTVLVYSDDEGEGCHYEGSGAASATTGRFDWSGTPTGTAFTLVNTDASGNTSEFSAALTRLKLSIDDALPHVVVNKVAGDADSPAGRTIVEVVAEVVSWDPSLKDDVDVDVTVPGDVFGSPVRVFVRDQVSNYDGATTAWTDLGSGTYRADGVDLVSVGSVFRRRVVFRFRIPNPTSPQNVYVQGQIQVPARTIRRPDDTATVRVVKPGNLRTIIVANRRLLYQNYTDTDVTGLLNRLYTEAQGPLSSHSPVGAVYYVDGYSTQARNWNSANVNYASETTANVVANAIDDLIEDWHDDATEYIRIPIFNFDLPIAWPAYLLIVGDDNTLPFYRYDDPSNDEGLNMFDCDGNPANGKEHPGWCIDSNTNPAIRATDEDFFFTDNVYADRWGTDWQTGDVELWVGRLPGDSAADMLNLLAQGVSWNNGQRGNVVMASVDGWELGLEPHVSGTGKIADLYDVTSLLRGKGFEVRNDDVLTSEVRTIDVMSPYEGGDASWNANFRNAANDAGGMDLFFIGGHDSYDHASIPGNNFDPAGTCAAATCAYNRFDDDHPLAMIVGCHGGLPVPNVGGIGGVNDDMVYDLVHEGASAYTGATGFSYGSPGDLHVCTFGERLIQRFFGQLLKPPGGNAMAVGKAMAEAKRDYVFGHGGNNALDRKTVTEFNLYGVPWGFIYYPNPATGAAARAFAGAEGRAFTVSSGPVIPAAQAGIYSRDFTVDIASYNAGTEAQGGIVYDLLSVPGGDLAIADGAPILPYLEAFTLTLPFGGTVVEVDLVTDDSSAEGTYNIPIAHVAPWTKGGVTYTTTTGIAYAYPADRVQRQETGEGVLFTVFPIQHNPTTDETTFTSHLQIRVTYEVPLPVGVTAFSTDKESYEPGETVRTSTTVGNVSDAEQTLVATLTIEDELGGAMGSLSSAPFSVLPGGSHELPLAWEGPLAAGSYRATVTLWSNDDLVGGDSAGFQVVDGRIVALTVPETLMPGEEAHFQVTFANYRTSQISAEVALSVYDDEGTLVAGLAPQMISVEEDSEETADFTWHPAGVSSGRHTAIATVDVEDRTYGPAQQSFQIGTSIYLPVVLRNVP
jgi:hypothetical protein